MATRRLFLVDCARDSAGGSLGVTKDKDYVCGPQLDALNSCHELILLVTRTEERVLLHERRSENGQQRKD